MAYFNSSYYQPYNDLGECHQIETSYDAFSNDSYNSVANYSSYKEPSMYNLFDYDPTSHYHAYKYNHSYDQHTPSWSTTCYSTFTPTESKSILYEPNSYHVIGFDQKRPQTQFVISYSVSEFNDPEFDEYDPTPYGGGYDIAQTYGKPLPPSDQICYPSSTAAAGIAKVLPFEDKPKQREKTHDHQQESQAEKPKEESKPKEAKDEGGKKELSQDENGTDHKQKTEEVIMQIPSGGNGYDYGNNQVSQIPSGYGLEATDLCGSIFGFWPCMTRYYARRPNNGNCHEGGYGYGYGYGYSNDHWNGAAEYLFGNSDPYVEKRDGGGSYGQPIHCYQRHYQEQPLTGQVQYDDQEEYSWSQNFNIF